MTKDQKVLDRRDFIKKSVFAGGGIVLGVNWMSSCATDSAGSYVAKALPSNWMDFNAYVKIGETGLVTIYSANPEIGQNIKTSMPMIVAEELDVDWRDVLVEQTGLNTEWYTRQVAGGSQSIRQGWESLRKAGASVREMLIKAAAQNWSIAEDKCRTENGIVYGPNNQQATYGELAAQASEFDVPEEPILKDPTDFKIIGKSQTNVDLLNIITGKPLFGIDTKKEGMVYACALRPPSFGKTLKRFDASETLQVNGVTDVFQFGDKVAVIASNTWAAMKGKKALVAEWEDGKNMESSTDHSNQLSDYIVRKADVARREVGDIEVAFSEADEVFERTYEAPFLPHNCLEPMNFYADVKKDSAYFLGPIQTPEWQIGRLVGLLGIDKENIKIDMTRMGGGFGRRLYGDFVMESAEISQKLGKPVQIVFSREDDMTAGTYRPASMYRFKVGIKNGEMSAYHLTEACFNGQMFGQMPSNFPCGAITNYRVDSHQLSSNITTGAWRAPYANFLAFAEQSFLDELAFKLGKDPVEYRIELLQKVIDDPQADELSYEPERLKGVIQLAAEKAGWTKNGENKNLGFCAYYSHNTYVAEVGHVSLNNGTPQLDKITCAVDCGIVINPTGAINQVKGGIIDGIGHAMYGDFSFENGTPQSENFHQYRLIRMSEAPEIDVHFVESTIDPTGLGEPTLPPAGAAVANAIAAATGKRFYKQPFVKELDILG